MSYLRYLTIHSLKKFNSNWEINLHVPRFPSRNNISWKTGEQSRPPLIRENFYDRALSAVSNVIEHDFEDYGIDNEMHEVHKSDLLRWKLLAEDGGVWSDMDIVYTNSIDNIVIENPLAHTSNTGIHIYPELSAHAIGFLFSSGNNEFFNNCFQLARQAPAGAYQAHGSTVLNTYFRKLSDIIDKFPQVKLCNISRYSVYPVLPTNIKDLFLSKPIDMSRSIGCHWYGGSELSLAYEERCCPGNIPKNAALSTIIDLCCV
jgi:hypothetical protein